MSESSRRVRAGATCYHMTMVVIRTSNEGEWSPHSDRMLEIQVQMAVFNSIRKEG